MKKKTTTSKRLTPAQIKKIFILADQGMSMLGISKKVGCSDSTVAYHLNK